MYRVHVCFFLFRYHNVAASLPDNDAALKKRATLNDKQDKSGQKVEKSTEGNPRRRKRGDDGNQQEMELSGVPIFLRDLLLALPGHQPAAGPPRPSSEAFIDQLRRTVLPPRPVTERGGGGYSDSALGLGSSHEVVPNGSGNKRKLTAADEEADFDREENYGDSRHDVFRQRRRVKMNPI